MARVFSDPVLATIHSKTAPQQTYIDLASKCPVRDLGEGVYALFRMDDIRYLNRHPAVEQGFKYLGSDRPAIPLGLDGEEHRKYRKLLDPVFAPRQVALLADKVRIQAHELIDGFVDRGAADAFNEWCEPLPSLIFLSIMGLPMEDHAEFLRFKHLILSDSQTDVPEDERVANVAEAVQWIQGYFNRDLDARETESEPRDDMIGWLLSTEVDGDRLTRPEVLDILGMLLLAGLDTIASSLGCILSYFARTPQHRERLVAEPQLVSTAVEELMRFESPVTAAYRLVTDDVTLPSGASLPAGSWAWVSWAAANLDPDAFPNPLEVDLDRKRNAHMSFASGAHRCLGSHLARLEMGVSLTAWHERIPVYEIEPGATLHYSGNPRAPRTLPLVWPT
ncbi:hypothetical protein AB431_00785 [Mycobacterium sp. EPa45]|nr:hypothetical protein AB431_00785 [Mycobacterium sp. EPa45]